MNKYLTYGSLLLVSSVLVAAEPVVKGDLWETTSQMSMAAMPMQMPITKVRVCQVKNRTEPPVATNSQQNCSYLNFQRTGSKVTWKVQCTGPAMTGSGELNYTGADSYTGVMTFTTEQGNMSINLTGKKVGECDNPR
jgi:hypothetical protein